MKLSREEIKARTRWLVDEFSEDDFDITELRSVRIFKVLHPIACELEKLGYPCTTDGRDIVTTIDCFKVDTGELPIPDNDYEKFKQMVLAGEYDMSFNIDLEETPEMTKAINEALVAGRTHITY